MRTEKELWARLASGINACSAGAHLVRVENAVGIGTPDSYIRIRGYRQPVWLELKTGTELSREQILWGRAEIAAGGRYCVAYGQAFGVIELHEMDPAGRLFELCVLKKNEPAYWKRFVAKLMGA